MAGTVAAVVVAAGRGLRAGGGVPKQYRPMPGGTAIQRSLAMFSGHGEIGLVQPVIHPDDQDAFQRVSAGFQLLPPVFGGATRQDSVRSGLEALAARKPDIVLIHDAARPFASAALITRAIAAAAKDGAAVPVLPVADTVKTVDAKGLVTGTLDRVAVARGADAAGVRICGDHRGAPPRAASRPRRFHRRRRARRMGRDEGCDLRRRGRQREAHHAGGFPARRKRQTCPTWATCAPGSAPTFTSSSTAITSGSAACGSRTRAASPAIPTPTWCCTAWSMRSSARFPTAISACTFRPAIRNGAAPPPTASWRSRSSAYARAAG